MTNPIRDPLNAIGRFLFSLYAPLRACGTENVPATGPFVLVINHVSGLDPVVAELASPRRIGFITKKEALRNPFLRFFVWAYSAIPVDRSKLDLNTARVAIGLLRAGTPILVAPEGTRSPDLTLGTFKSGYLKLAAAARAPVVPVGIYGTHKVLPRRRRFPVPGRITVRFGKPYDAFLASPEELHGDGAERHNLAIRAIVQSLIDASR